MKVKTIDLIAKEWHDSENGNSYFSAELTINFKMSDAATFILPFQYGYERQYETEAMYVLVKHGYIDEASKYSAIWRFCKENGIALNSHKIDNCKKSDL